MSLCQIELMNAGKPYPRTCQTCGLGGACVKGLVRGAPDRNPTSLPEFDAHGWCHDMSAAPRDGTAFLVSWPSLIGMPWFIQAAKWHDIYGCFVIDWDHDDGAGPFRAWRPLPLPPVMEKLK